MADDPPGESPDQTGVLLQPPASVHLLHGRAHNCAEGKGDVACDTVFVTIL